MRELIIQSLLIMSTLAHLVAGVGLLRVRPRVGWTAFGLGWLALVAVWIINAIHLGEPPFGNMYHVLVVISLCFLPAYLLLAWKEGITWPAPAFALMAVIPIVGCVFMDHGASWSRMPALQSGWFVPHVATYTLSYSLAATAFALLLSGRGRYWWSKRRTKRQADQPAVGIEGTSVHDAMWQRHAEAAHQVLRVAIPFMTIGLCSGALWAERAWGAYWQWDTKETWSLITWMLYVMALHGHGHGRLRTWAPVLQVMGFIALLITFLGVSLISQLGSALHSYA